MPRKGISYCPKCKGYGCKLIKDASGKVVKPRKVHCEKCGHVWRTRARFLRYD